MKINIEVLIVIVIVILIVVVFAGFFLTNSGSSQSNVDVKKSLVSGCLQWQQRGCDPEDAFLSGDSKEKVSTIYNSCKLNGVEHCYEYCCKGGDFIGP